MFLLSQEALSLQTLGGGGPSEKSNRSSKQRNAAKSRKPHLRFTKGLPYSRQHIHDVVYCHQRAALHLGLRSKLLQCVGRWKRRFMKRCSPRRQTHTCHSIKTPRTTSASILPPLQSTTRLGLDRKEGCWRSLWRTCHLLRDMLQEGTMQVSSTVYESPPVRQNALSRGDVSDSSGLNRHGAPSYTNGSRPRVEHHIHVGVF